MVAVNDVVFGPKLVRIDLLGGGAAAFANVARRREGVLTKELAIGDDNDAEGGQDEAFEFS